MTILRKELYAASLQLKKAITCLLASEPVLFGCRFFKIESTVEKHLPSEDGEALFEKQSPMTIVIPKFDSNPNHAEVLHKWFAVYVMPRHEKRIADHFRLRQIEHFLPLYSTIRRWQDGTKVNLQLPLFPSYIFVRIARSTRVRVLEVPGVLSLVGCGLEASPVPDLYIESLREGLRLHRIEPHPYLVNGARVRIKRGAMAGIEGVLLQKKNGFRVVLTLDLIMKSMSVEVDIDEVEPTGPQPRILPSVTPSAIA